MVRGSHGRQWPASASRGLGHGLRAPWRILGHGRAGVLGLGFLFGFTFYLLSQGGAAAPRTPCSEFSRFAPGPRPPIHEKNHMPASKILRKAIRNNKNDKRKGAGASRHPRGIVDFGISDCFSNDFACRHAVFLMSLGPWPLERSDLTQSGGSGGRQPPGEI